MHSKLVRLVFRNEQYSRVRMADSDAFGQLDTVVRTQYRLDYRQIDRIGMAVGQVLDVRSRSGLEHHMAALAQNLSEYRPERVVIVHKKNRVHSAYSRGRS